MEYSRLHSSIPERWESDPHKRKSPAFFRSHLQADKGQYMVSHLQQVNLGMIAVITPSASQFFYSCGDSGEDKKCLLCYGFQRNSGILLQKLQLFFCPYRPSSLLLFSKPSGANEKAPDHRSERFCPQTAFPLYVTAPIYFRALIRSTASAVFS